MFHVFWVKKTDSEMFGRCSVVNLTSDVIVALDSCMICVVFELRLCWTNERDLCVTQDATQIIVAVTTYANLSTATVAPGFFVCKKEILCTML